MRALLRLGLGLCAAAFSPALAVAAADPPKWHLFFGSAGAERSMFGYGGFVWSPWQSLDDSGWQLRGFAVTGTDDYGKAGGWVRTQVGEAELLAGYRWMRPAHGVTVSLGPAFSDIDTQPYDPDKERQGTRGGGKLLVEGWHRLSPMLVVSGSASYSTARRAYAARLAATIELTGRLSLEPELQAFGEPGHDEIRIGLFADVLLRENYRIAAGGGWAFDPDGDGPYAGLRLKMWR